jgi:hypothetical protein
MCKVLAESCMFSLVVDLKSTVAHYILATGCQYFLKYAVYPHRIRRAESHREKISLLVDGDSFASIVVL